MFRFHPRQARPSRSSQRRNRQHVESSNIEALESRWLPATLINATTLTFQDIDGDDVTVKLSQPILTAANVNSVFTFSTGAGAVNGGNSVPELLLKIDVANALPLGTITNLTTTATKSATHGGDGFATVGDIEATGRILGTVNLDGDLGRIHAAGATGLITHTIGRFGTDTGAIDLTSLISGNLNALRIKGDFKDALLAVSGDLGSITIGGSLINRGGFTTGLIGAGKIGTAQINGDVVGGIVVAETTIGSILVKGSIRGGVEVGSGVIAAQGGMGTVRVFGSVLGGGGAFSGVIDVGTGKLGSLIVSGSIRGGEGESSGTVLAAEIGDVTIGRDLIGYQSAAVGSAGGSIVSNGKLGNVTIGGSLIGGLADSGRIKAVGDIGLIRVRGHVVGGGDVLAGSIVSDGNIAGVILSGNLKGGAGQNSGFISSVKLGNVTIGGSVLGSSGSGGGQIESHGDMGVVKIAGSLVGGGDGTGVILSNGKIASLSIGGSIVGGSDLAGRVEANGEITTVNIVGDIIGGNSSLNALSRSGFLGAGRIERLTLNGSLIAGVDNTLDVFESNGAIRVHHDLGTVLIRRNVVGNDTNPAIISARGKQTVAPGVADIAIGSLTVNGRVENGLIQAGVDILGFDANADAQITTVKVNGNWIASTIVAGIWTGLDDQFGTNDDAVMLGPFVKNDAIAKSKIGALTIVGQAFGTVGGTDSFAFTAQQVSSLKIGGTAQATTAAIDDFFVGSTFDLRLREFA